MKRWLFRVHGFIFRWRNLFVEETVALLLVLFIFISPASAAMRLQDRSLYMNSAEPGATTSYTVSFRYMSPQAIGSVDLLFCSDPIPYHPCATPAGLDVSNASLVNQTGETGYAIQSKTTNHIVLSRPPQVAGLTGVASYTFEGIKNPTDTSLSFSVRLRTHEASNATGPQVDFGSVKGQVANGIILETQVPPMLIFCVAQEVADECESTNETYYTDMGDLDDSSTLTAQSQMAVGTNATGGFAITVNGSPLAAGTNTIDGMGSAGLSQAGTNQFGINLVKNNELAVGLDPEGSWTNAVPSNDYATPDRYKFVSGDVVAFSPNVSLMKKFTVSYIVNASPSLKAGVYSTTINYIASGRF